MSGCRETYKEYLLRGYATSPLDASIHFFATLGNGMEWDKEGNLVSWSPDKSPIKNKVFKATECPEIPTLDTKWRLETDARRIKYEWVQANIEAILDSPVDSSFFQMDHRDSHYVTKHICYGSTKCTAFEFPDNIQPDWAQALYCFLEWWSTMLRRAYGVGSNGNTDFWTSKQKADALAIQDATEHLYEIIHGEPYKTAMERMTALAKEIIDEADAKEKSHDPV